MASTTLRALTFNIGNGRAATGSLIPMLRSTGADLVALQEVSETQGAALDAELTDIYPHRVVRATGLAGKALLSKTPILADEDVRLHCGRPHLRARVVWNGGELQALVAHVPLEDAVRGPFGKAVHEIDRLVELTLADPPSLLLGDFNKTPFSLLYWRLARSGLRDAFRHAGRGCGFTFPVFGRYHRIPLPPLVRIDYIWHTPDLRTVACWRGADGGSDHLPVEAELVPSSDQPA